MTHAKAIVAGEDLKAGDVLVEKDGRAYCLREGEAEWDWQGIAKDDTPKGKPVIIVQELDIKEA